MNNGRKAFEVVLACAVLMSTVAAIIPGSETPFGITVGAADIKDSGECGENINYTLNNKGTLTVSGTGAMYDYYFDDSPFRDNSDIIKVIIEDGVTSIGYSAFSSCTTLRTVIIPDSVTSIGYGAFENCTALKSITLPDGVDSIEENSFRRCTSLTSIKIPGSVTSIGACAFGSCTSLKNIDIPDSVTSIGAYAFDETLWYDALPDGVVYIGKTAYKYKGEMHENTNIKIKDGTTGIADCAFENFSSLKGMTIPDSVGSIGEYAFSGCTSLKSITVPDSVTSIGMRAFDETQWYKDQADGVVYAGRVAYKYKGDMPENTKIKLKNGTVGISDFAFFGCSSLKRITIPEGVVNIGNSAFSECTSLTDVTIPDGVISIGYGAFDSCDSVKSIAIPDSVTSIGVYGFGYVYDPEKYRSERQPGFTIIGSTGSEAESYANDNGFKFILLGDVNDDGLSDIGDSLLAARADSRLLTITDAQKKAADVNRDGSADIADALLIARVDAGLATL